MLLTQIILRGGGAKVTVSGQLVLDALSNQAAIQFDTDGNVYSQVNNGSLVQVDTDTDWVRPVAAAPGSYEVFATQNSGGSVTGPSLDTWLALTSDRKWEVGAGVTAELDISIRLGSSVLDTGTYTLTAT